MSFLHFGPYLRAFFPQIVPRRPHEQVIRLSLPLIGFLPSVSAFVCVVRVLMQPCLPSQGLQLEPLVTRVNAGSYQHLFELVNHLNDGSGRGALVLLNPIANKR